MKLIYKQVPKKVSESVLTPTPDRFIRLMVCLLLSGMLWLTPVYAQPQTWTVNFKETDIQELVRFVANATGKTVVIDPKVKGKVRVVSSKPVDRTELYDLFLSILEVHGFAAVESGEVVRIIPAKDARTAPVRVSSARTRQGNSEIITQVIQLNNISAAKLIPVLRPLAPQQAHMAAYAPSNAIIVSDTTANIARIREVIERIDRTAQEQTELVTLNHASAEEVVRMLERLQKSEASKDVAVSKQSLLVADKRTNSVLINGDELQRQRMKALIMRLDTPLAQSGNVRVIYLKYADAAELAGVLTRVIQNIEGFSAVTTTAAAPKTNATIEADEGTNSLIVTADADIMQSLTAVIDRLDIRRAQVLVEAIIVELTDDDGRALGLQWLFLDSDDAYGSSSANSLLGATSRGVAKLAADQDATDLLSALAGTPGQVLGVAGEDGDLSFNLVINALSENTDANILSTPSLLTLDNEEASIVVGQNVPFVTGSFTATGSSGSNPDNPFQTIERSSVGINLRVTPHINEGDSLVLEIAQEVSSLTGAATEFDATDVITNERKIETKVLADNGQTIVLGGLVQDDVQNSVQKVPLLGDIPVMGRLFRNSSSSVLKRHLLVFLRPTIIRDSHTLSGATAEKYRRLRDLQLNKISEGVDLYSSEALPLLPEWQEAIKAYQAAPSAGGIPPVSGKE